MVLRRLLGIVMLVIALAGLALCALGAYFGPQFVDGLVAVLGDNLTLASQSMTTVGQTLELARGSIEDVQSGLETLETAALDLSRTMTQTEPLLDELTQLAAEDVPDSLEAVQTAVPRMAEAAGVVEGALTSLSNLRLEQNILGVPLRFDLGFRYNPETTMAESILDLASSLDEVIPRLRGLESHLEGATGNLVVIGEDLGRASADVQAINARLSGIGPLLDSYIATTRQVQGLIDGTSTQLENQINQIKVVLWVTVGWLALLQLMPLYLAWELLTQEPVDSD